MGFFIKSSTSMTKRKQKIGLVPFHHFIINIERWQRSSWLLDNGVRIGHVGRISHSVFVQFTDIDPLELSVISFS